MIVLCTESAPLTRSGRSSSILELAPAPQPPPPPPGQLAACLRLWDESARSLVSFSPGLGRTVAVSGARHSVQLLPAAQVTARSGNPVDTETLVTAGWRLVGHAGAVTSLAWSRAGDWLVTAGQDQVARLWDWRLELQTEVVREDFSIVESIPYR